MLYSPKELKEILNEGIEELINEQLTAKNISTSKINIKRKVSFVNYMKRIFKDGIIIIKKVGDLEITIEIEHDEVLERISFFADFIQKSNENQVYRFSLSKRISYYIRAKGKLRNGYELSLYADKRYEKDNGMSTDDLNSLITYFFENFIIGIHKNMQDENIIFILSNMDHMRYSKACKLEKTFSEIKKSKPNNIYINQFSNEKTLNNYKRFRDLLKKLRANKMYVSSNFENFITLMEPQEGQIHGVKFDYLGRSFTASIRLVEEDIRILETFGHYASPNHGAETLLFTVDNNVDILESFLDYIHEELEGSALEFLINKPLKDIKRLLVDVIKPLNPNFYLEQEVLYNTEDKYLNSILHTLHTALEPLNEDVNRILFVLDKLKRGEYTEDQISVTSTYHTELAEGDTLPDDSLSEKHILITFKILGKLTTLKIHQLKDWFEK